MSRIVCVSNRVSVPDPETGAIKAGGLAVGVRAALEANGGGLWFGWDGSVFDPRERKRKLNRFVYDDIAFLTFPLTEKEYSGYYKNMANENLWPLMHGLGRHIDGDAGAYRIYKKVNRLFARLLKPFLKPGDIVWVHDYHLMKLGRELRALGVRNRLGYFHHTPVPDRDFLNGPGMPGFLKAQYGELLADLFDYDLVGFQSFRDFRNFAGRLSGLRHEPSRYQSVPLHHRGKQARFGVFPIGIETGELVRQSKKSAGENSALLGDRERYKILIGAERLDYTKGIAGRLEGFHEFLNRNPEYRNRVRYHQIAPLSRSDIRQYQDAIEKTRHAAEKIRNEFGHDGWEPLAYSEEGLPRDRLLGGFRHADVGLVTPLIDGQNLVAKEYLAAQDPRDPGMLVLSKTAGAAEELEDLGVLCVDPYDPGDIADKIRQALETPRLQRLACYRKSISHLDRYDVAHWAESFLDQIKAARAERSRMAGSGEKSWYSGTSFMHYYNRN